MDLTWFPWNTILEQIQCVYFDIFIIFSRKQVCHLQYHHLVLFETKSTAVIHDEGWLQWYCQTITFCFGLLSWADDIQDNEEYFSGAKSLNLMLWFEMITKYGQSYQFPCNVLLRDCLYQHDLKTVLPEWTTMMSHKCHGVPNHWQLLCLFNSLIKPTKKKT